MGAKQKQFVRLVRELDITVENRTFDWLTNRISPRYETLWRMFIALGGNPEAMLNKRVRRLVPDGYLPKSNRLIEFDELQHFTAFRRDTLSHYPSAVEFGFNMESYRSLCDQHASSAFGKGAAGYRARKPEFPFDGGRAAQRALFDACRDLLPLAHGLSPTIRVPEFELPSLLDSRDDAIDEVRKVLADHL